MNAPDIARLRDTITPKSQQLNADDLIAGPITVKIVGVKRGDTAEQPISIEIDGGRMPYLPCKSMRRVMIAAWGDDGREWIGRKMTLYCDPDVKFGGVKVGGIRISHMSGINGRRAFMLTTTRSKRSEFYVDALVDSDAATLQKIKDAKTGDELKAVYADAYKAARKAGADTAALESAYKDRKQQLESSVPATNA